jgi:hypothetical protein
MVGCETFSTEGTVKFGKIFLELLTTSFPNTSPSAAKVQMAMMLFVPE